MNSRGDFAEDYQEARRVLREQWTDSSGDMRCPECEMEAFNWSVQNGGASALTVECELCNLVDWMHFDGGIPWSENL